MHTQVYAQRVYTLLGTPWNDCSVALHAPQGQGRQSLDHYQVDSYSSLDTASGSWMQPGEQTSLPSLLQRLLRATHAKILYCFDSPSKDVRLHPSVGGGGGGLGLLYRGCISPGCESRHRREGSRTDSVAQQARVILNFRYRLRPASPRCDPE